MSLTPVTLDELQPFVDASKDHIVAYGMMGSAIYGLGSPDSDRDIVAVVEGLHDFDSQTIVGDKDCRVMSVGSLTIRLSYSIPNEVDLVRSDMFKVVYDEYRPFLYSHRFSVYEYMRLNQQQIGKTQIKMDLPTTADQKRRERKSMKTAVRCAMMNRRAAEAGDRDFPVRFTDSEQAEYWRNVLEVTMMRDDGASREDVVDKIMTMQVG